jgi:hypothetical protein
LTDSRKPPFLRQRRKDRSKIDQNALDLWGIAAIGEIFSLGRRIVLDIVPQYQFCLPHLYLLGAFCSEMRECVNG